MASGTFLLPGDFLWAKMPVGIQLYTIRDMMSKDVTGTLKMLSTIGYQELEAAGYMNRSYYGIAPREFKTMLGDLGLSMPSGHYTTGRVNEGGYMTKGWEAAVEDAKEVGQEYMVCAFLFPDERKTLSQYQELMELLNTCGETCKKAGIQFAYHNHDFEFQEVEGKIPYDIMLKETDADLVKMELDLYWTEKAGYDPVKLFEENPGRYPLWHVKDMDAEGNFAAVGTGTIDFKRIFKASKTAGLDHFFVEQDRINGDVKETISTSFMNAKKLA